MQISRVQSQNQSFKGLEQAANPKMANFVINGVGGRIGRNTARKYFEAKMTPVGVLDKWDKAKKEFENLNLTGMNIGSFKMKNGNIADVPDEPIVNLFKHDSILGDIIDLVKFGVKRTGEKTETTDTREVFLTVESKFAPKEEIKLVATHDNVEWERPEKLIFFDTTGNNNTVAKLKAAAAGARYAVLSAPAKDDMLTSVAGVNSTNIDKIDSSGGVISAASCTTTCITPVIKLLEEKFGIKSHIVETTHSGTGTQYIHDKADYKSESKSRASYNSLVPTTTGAAGTAKKVVSRADGSEIPMDGLSTRVPVSNVSLSSMFFVLNQKTTLDEIKKVFKEAAEGEYKDIISIADKGSSSLDMFKRPEHVVIVPEAMKLVNGDTLLVKGYYDNEYGYSTQATKMMNQLAEKIIAEQQ